MTLRTSVAAGRQARFFASPIGDEDYIASVEVEPMQEVTIHIGLTIVAEREFAGEITLGRFCKGRQVVVSFPELRSARVAFKFGRLKSCSLWKETCHGSGHGSVSP